MLLPRNLPGALRVYSRRAEELGFAELWVVDDRLRIGDWEGGLIVGRMSRSAIGTLVDRTSRLVRLVHLPDGHAAEHLVEGLLPVL